MFRLLSFIKIITLYELLIAHELASLELFYELNRKYLDKHFVNLKTNHSSFNIVSEMGM